LTAFSGATGKLLRTVDGTLDESDSARFFRDYLMSGGRYVRQGYVQRASSRANEATGFSPKALAGRVAASVRVLMRLYRTESGHESEQVTRAMAAERSESYDHIAAIGAIREARYRRDHSTQLALFTADAARFILRRFVCGESCGGYGQMFVRALAKDEGDQVKALDAYLLDRG